MTLHALPIAVPAEEAPPGGGTIFSDALSDPDGTTVVSRQGAPVDPVNDVGAIWLYKGFGSSLPDNLDVFTNQLRYIGSTTAVWYTQALPDASAVLETRLDSITTDTFQGIAFHFDPADANRNFFLLSVGGTGGGGARVGYLQNNTQFRISQLEAQPEAGGTMRVEVDLTGFCKFWTDYPNAASTHYKEFQLPVSFPGRNVGAYYQQGSLSGPRWDYYRNGEGGSF